MSKCASVFPGRDFATGEELAFRAVCALGWAIDQNFADFSVLVEDKSYPWNIVGWTIRLERDVIDKLGAASDDCDRWPSRMRQMLESLAGDLKVSRRPGASEFLLKVAPLVETADALDPVKQLREFNQRGFDLASKMLCDRKWSPPAASSLWGNHRMLEVTCLEDDTEGTFTPETLETSLLFKVKQNRFQTSNALLEYLKLEFEFFHEYISHVLPIWHSAGNRLEDEMLLLAENWFYCTLDRRVHRPEFVDISDERSNDHRRDRRRMAKPLEILAGAPRISQLMIELATLPEEALSSADKDLFLSNLMKKQPTLDPAFVSQLATESIPALCTLLND